MAVRSVAKHFPTAIVSGRCRDKVRTPKPHQHPPTPLLPSSLTIADGN